MTTDDVPLTVTLGHEDWVQLYAAASAYVDATGDVAVRDACVRLRAAIAPPRGYVEAKLGVELPRPTGRDGFES